MYDRAAIKADSVRWYVQARHNNPVNRPLELPQTPARLPRLGVLVLQLLAKARNYATDYPRYA